MKATTLLAVLVGTVTAAFAVTLPASDSDLFWHLASGDWMLDHGRILDRDVFSYTRAGTPYASGQWLGQIALALAFRGGGWLGIDLLRAILVGVCAFFAARATLRVQSHPLWALPPLVLTLLVTKITWGDRPQLFTLALFAIVFDLLLSARLEGRVRRLAFLPLLFLLWANLHGAFAAGLALVAIFAVEAAYSRVRWRMFSFVAVVSLVASQLTVEGPGVLGWIASYAATPVRFIVEERPVDILSGPGLVVASLLLVTLGGALVLGRAGVERCIGAPALWSLLAISFALLGIAIQRQLPLACIVLTPLVAGIFPAALGRARAAVPIVPRGVAGLVVVASLVGVLLTAWQAAPRDPDLSQFPVGALAPLRSARGNLLNEYDWGGFLIREAPGQPVFVDGRGERLLGRRIVSDFERMVRVREGFRGPLADWNIKLALLRPNRPLVEVLRSDGWRTLASDDHFVLLERP